ncbi:MAG: S9 family peptidase [Piscinibacter sp.]|nr:S9 family peptidase [Piscinibacter sp.]
MPIDDRGGWMRALRAGAVAALMGATLSAPLAAQAAAGPPPVEHYTRLPEIDDVTVSPSGKRLALLVFGPDGRRRVGVMDLDPVGRPRIVAGFGDADINEVQWVSDDRLVFEAHEPGAEVRQGGAGTFAVDHDGTRQRQLIAWRHSTARVGSHVVSRVLPYGWDLHSVTDDGSGDVFVQQRVHDAVGDLERVQLARLSTLTGELTPLSLGAPPGTFRWLLDPQGEPRLLIAQHEGRRQVYRRRDASADWEKIADYEPLLEGGFLPWHAGADGRIWVLSRRSGQGQALYELDPASGRAKAEAALAVPGFDLRPTKVIDPVGGRLLGVHFVADRPRSYWFDETLQRLQLGIDAALPAGRSNRLLCGRCTTSRWFVVRSSSDRLPAEYLLFDREKGTLLALGTARPWIDEATQGRRSLHRVPARDGLSLPLYVTRPAGAAEDTPLPAVVLVHGGPWVRGADLGWSAQAQFLASRGYLVLEPEFRGSEGYGFELFQAGWKEWGRAMQTDLEDVVRWAAQRRLADPARVCVVGASYGGYAALMAPIATPGTFRCAASFAGVTDISLMYDISWSDISEAARQYSMPVLIGARQADAERLDAASPLKRVAEIKVPLLVAHGGLDRRVPIAHARAFVEAARRAGVPVQELTYPDEGHGFFRPANRVDYYRRLEEFLARSLRGAP